MKKNKIINEIIINLIMCKKNINETTELEYYRTKIKKWKEIDTNINPGSKILCRICEQMVSYDDFTVCCYISYRFIQDFVLKNQV